MSGDVCLRSIRAESYPRLRQSVPEDSEYSGGYTNDDDGASRDDSLHMHLSTVSCHCVLDQVMS